MGFLENIFHKETKQPTISVEDNCEKELQEYIRDKNISIHKGEFGSSVNYHSSFINSIIKEAKSTGNLDSTKFKEHETIFHKILYGTQDCIEHVIYFNTLTYSSNIVESKMMLLYEIMSLIDYKNRQLPKDGAKDSSLDKFIKLLNSYTKFIKTAENLIIYTNDYVDDVSCTVVDNESILTFTFDDYTVSYSFYKVKKPEKSDNLLEDYLEGESDKFIYYCKIKIHRTTTNGTTSEFTYVIGNEDKFNFETPAEDFLLLQMVVRDTYASMVNNFDYILENFINRYIGVTDNTRYGWDVKLCLITGIL
jgi:hypothetical protein